jgi:type IV pilus assembly protein PilQ
MNRTRAANSGAAQTQQTVQTFPAVTLKRGGPSEWVGEPISVDFKDIDIKDFFRFIAEISGMNMILDPTVKGSLTVKLTEVPWDQALDIVCRNNGLGYEIDGNVMSVKK